MLDDITTHMLKPALPPFSRASAKSRGEGERGERAAASPPLSASSPREVAGVGGLAEVGEVYDPEACLQELEERRPGEVYDPEADLQELEEQSPGFMPGGEAGRSRDPCSEARMVVGGREKRAEVQGGGPVCLEPKWHTVVQSPPTHPC